MAKDASNPTEEYAVFCVKRHDDDGKETSLCSIRDSSGKWHYHKAISVHNEKEHNFTIEYYDTMPTQEELDSLDPKKYMVPRFKPLDKNLYNHHDLWQDKYPLHTNYEGEFIKLYTCDDYPEYLFGYGKVLWDKLYDFTLIRTRNQIDNSIYNDDFTTFLSSINEERAIEVFREYLQNIQ